MRSAVTASAVCNTVTALMSSQAEYLGMVFPLPMIDNYFIISVSVRGHTNDM